MKKINIRDYKGDYVCYYNEYSDIELIGSDDIETIKEIIQDGYIIYGTDMEYVFEESFIEYISDYFIDYVNANGYEDMNDRIDYDGESFQKVKNAVREFIKSLGDDNKCYSPNENIIIEVE